MQKDRLSVRRILFIPLFIVLCGLLAFSCDFQTDSKERLGHTTSAIINGKFDLRHPAVGTITINKSTFCTATLISPRLLLTAAHCMDVYKNVVQYGSVLHFRSDRPDPSMPEGYRSTFYPINSHKLSTHPNWGAKPSFSNDLAIAVLQNPITNIQPIPPNLNKLLPGTIGNNVLAMGYGMLQTMPRPIRTHAKFSVILRLGQVRTDRLEVFKKNSSACHGDSGGPALAAIKGKLYVIGVISHGITGNVPGESYSKCDSSGFVIRTDFYFNYIKSFLLSQENLSQKCQLDQECGLCGVCINNKCKNFHPSKSALDCKPCKKDQDCKGGICHETKDGYRCLQLCKEKMCCPSGRFCQPLRGGLRKQVNDRLSACIPPQLQCPVVKCQKDQECGKKGECHQGKCRYIQAKRSKTLCKPCKEHSDCDSGKGLCAGLPGYRYCTQPCTKERTCMPGFQCRHSITYQGIQCFPKGNTCSFSCQNQKDCPNGLECSSGLCKPKQVGIIGAPCNKTSCKKGLSCVPTLSGKYCFLPCGVKPGVPGGTCDKNNQCKNGARCLNSRREDRCFIRCKQASDCHAYGTKRCQGSLCQCQSQADCAQDHICHRNFCFPKKDFKTCPSKLQCSNIISHPGQYCIPKQVKYLAIGQSCDHINQCKAGLICLSKSGFQGYCAEPCGQTGACKLGGHCTSYKSAKGVIKACFCLSSSSCPSGKVCVPRWSRWADSKKYGHCLDLSPSMTCNDDRECMYKETCVKKRCQAPSQPEKSKESTIEKPKESTIEKVEEKQVKMERADEPDVLSNDVKPERTSLDAGKFPESRVQKIQFRRVGCSCQSQKGGLSVHFLWIFSLLFWLRAKKSSNHL